MREIEAKILEVNAAEVKQRLLDLGAKKIFAGELISIGFDFPDRRLSKEEILLRLRQEGERTTLTYKKLVSIGQSKISEELQITVDNFETTQKILSALGLAPKPGYPLAKHRVSYLLDGVHFELDTFANIPTFLEIEASSDDIIRAYALKLGFTPGEIKPWGAREVFAHYRAQGKIK